MKKAIQTLFPLLILAATACSHAQLPPTSHGVNVTGSAPSACTATAPCTFVFSHAVLAAGVTSCPDTSGTTNYTPLNADSPSSAVAYDDTSSAGKTVCIIAQTKQGTSVSVASNAIGPYAVLPNPQAPTLNSGQVSKAEPTKHMLMPTGNIAAPILAGD
jgi:hypothetical protein